MATIRINNPTQGNFTILPNAIFEHDLPLQSIALFAYLLSLKDGTIVSARQIQKKFNMAKATWQKYLRALRDLGIVRYEYVADEFGVISNRVLTVDTDALERYRETTSKAHGKKPRRKGIKSDPSTGQFVRALNTKLQNYKELTPFQLTQLRQNQPVIIDGKLLKPTQKAYAMLRVELERARSKH